MQRVLVSAFLSCVVSSAAVYAADAPDVKTGLWTTTTTSGDGEFPTQTVSMCTSTALLQTLSDRQFKNPKQPCRRISIAHTGSTITEQTECKLSDAVVRSKAVTVVTGDTAVHTEIHREGKSTVIVSDSKYVGACPPGMQLGDFTGTDGVKSNILHPDNAKTPAKTP